MKSISKENLFFYLLLSSINAYFIYWGIEYTHANHLVIFLLATFFMILMAFNIGGNDVVNSFGTSVGAKTLTLKQALIVAAIFEVSGAMIAGGEVTKTIRKGIVNLGELSVSPQDFIFIMMSALFAAALWLLVATRKSWPVSTTHSIIGGIVGSSITLGIVLEGGGAALELVHWDKIGTIALSWIISPVLGGLFAYLIYFGIKRSVLTYNERANQSLTALKDEKKRITKMFKEQCKELKNNRHLGIHTKNQMTTEESKKNLRYEFYKVIYKIKKQKTAVNSHHALQHWVPIIAALGSMIITAMLFFKGLKHMHLDITLIDKFFIMLMISTLVWVTIYIFARSLKNRTLDKSSFVLFSWLQIFTASAFAFSHGSNDIANAIGPFAAILDVLRTGDMASTASVPPIAMFTAGVAMIAGLWFLGAHVIKTVGEKLTLIHPASGFSAELAASAVILMASTVGIPVSSTHILIGAVLGVSLVNHSTNWTLMRSIGMAWIITIPSAAFISALTFLILRALF
jgi:inorganic phosphate transporter, PiT family